MDRLTAFYQTVTTARHLGLVMRETYHPGAPSPIMARTYLKVCERALSLARGGFEVADLAESEAIGCHSHWLIERAKVLRHALGLPAFDLCSLPRH